MAVAKAQFAISDIVSMLRSKGINVRFAIHPVAGRYILSVVDGLAMLIASR